MNFNNIVENVKKNPEIFNSLSIEKLTEIIAYLSESNFYYYTKISYDDNASYHYNRIGKTILFLANTRKIKQNIINKTNSDNKNNNYYNNYYNKNIIQNIILYIKLLYNEIYIKIYIKKLFIILMLFFILLSYLIKN